jgi:putative Holliday junction resolvase
MKCLGLDIGDAWTGIALSDALGMFARPYQTIAAADLTAFLTSFFVQEQIRAVIIGHPKTMRGTASAQTEKVEKTKAMLEQQFPDVQWILWDERLSSKRASQLKPARSKEEKLQQHAVAAAFILSSYLESQYQSHTSPLPNHD